MLSTVSTRRGHFQMESGYHTDLWMDLETLYRHPRQLQPVAAALASRLRPHRVDAVCGPLNEGAFVALQVAAELDCDFTYAERLAQPERAGLFTVSYRVPAPQRSLVSGRRIAIVNDVISAGSAVRGASEDLRAHDADVVVIGALLVLGSAIGAFARDRQIAIEALAEEPFAMWTPSECPLCREGVAIEVVA